MENHSDSILGFRAWGVAVLASALSILELKGSRRGTFTVDCVWFIRSRLVRIPPTSGFSTWAPSVLKLAKL